MESQEKHASSPTDDGAAVLHESDVPPVRWDDPLRGLVTFQTLLGGDGPSGALTAGLAELAPGDRLGRHRHTPAELYYVVEGEGLVTLDDTEHRVRAGSLVHIPGDTEHGVRNTGQDRLRFFYTLTATALDDVEYHFCGHGS